MQSRPRRPSQSGSIQRAARASSLQQIGRHHGEGQSSACIERSAALPRYVWLPVELRFEGQGTSGRAVLRLALLDPRAAEAKWVGDVQGDGAASAALAMQSVATRLASLFVAP